MARMHASALPSCRGNSLPCHSPPLPRSAPLAHTPWHQAYREHQATAARISLPEEARTLVAFGK